jgi:hypothetical protein
VRVAHSHATYSYEGRQDTDQSVCFVLAPVYHFVLGSIMTTASTTYLTTFFHSVKLASAPLADASFQN